MKARPAADQVRGQRALVVVLVPGCRVPGARARTGPRSVEKVVNGYADFQMSSKNCSPGYMERVAAWLPGEMTPGLAELFV